jgi:hypothetical protein
MTFYFVNSVIRKMSTQALLGCSFRPSFPLIVGINFLDTPQKARVSRLICGKSIKESREDKNGE